MYTTQMLQGLLVEGAIGGTALTLLAFAVWPYWRHVLALVLVVAAVVYVGFATRAGAGAAWIAAEVIGVAAYGAAAVLALRRSAWWLVAGWALHPLWDIALHFLGPGRAFAPESYTVPCLSWDLVVAAMVAVRLAWARRRVGAPPMLEAAQ